MEVKFDLVRIGKRRKDNLSEKILKQNVDILRHDIRLFLRDKESNTKYNEISMAMIIPGSGYSIKIALADIQDKNLRKELRNNFPEAVYKGKYSVILDNIHNSIFSL